MKTLEEIKDEVAQEMGFLDWVEMFYEEGYEIGDSGIDEVARRYAKEVARESLRNAADKYQDMLYYVVEETDSNIRGVLNIERRTLQPCYAVPKQTILNESNIPEL